MDSMQVALMSATTFNASSHLNVVKMGNSSLYMERYGVYVIKEKVVQFLMSLSRQLWEIWVEMERAEGEVGKKLGIYMARIAGAMEFLITLTSRNAEMQLTESRASNELLSHWMGLLELKSEHLQLAAEMMEFRVKNLGRRMEGNGTECNQGNNKLPGDSDECGTKGGSQH